MTLKSTKHHLFFALSFISLNTSFAQAPAVCPSANAGNDKRVCGNVNEVNLMGIVMNGMGVTTAWKTLGTGTFSDSTTSATLYLISAADTTAKSVKLIFKTAGTTNCESSADTMTVFFTPAPIAKAGPAQTVCASVTDVQLDGKVTLATGGTWTTSGSGIFSPSPASLNAKYAPSAADKASAKVKLTLTTTGITTCPPDDDNLSIFFDAVPAVSAGPDQTVCTGSSVVLNGAITDVTSATWTSSGSGTFSPSADKLDATYAFSPADVTAGSVSLTLTTGTKGACDPVSDLMTATTSVCTGIMSSTSISEMSISPNPSQGSVNIELISNDFNSLTITSVEGVEIMNQQISGSNVTVDGLKHGIYMVKVISNDKLLVRKLVVQ